MGRRDVLVAQRNVLTSQRDVLTSQRDVLMGRRHVLMGRLRWSFLALGGLISEFLFLVRKVAPESLFHGVPGCFWVRIVLGVFLCVRGLDFRGFGILLGKLLQKTNFMVLRVAFGPGSLLVSFLGAWGLDLPGFGSLLGEWLRSDHFVVFRDAFEPESLWMSFWLPGGWIFEVFVFCQERGSRGLVSWRFGLCWVQNRSGCLFNWPGDRNLCVFTIDFESKR